MLCISGMTVPVTTAVIPAQAGISWCEAKPKIFLWVECAELVSSRTMLRTSGMTVPVTTAVIPGMPLPSWQLVFKPGYRQR